MAELRCAFCGDPITAAPYRVPKLSDLVARFVPTASTPGQEVIHYCSEGCARARRLFFPEEDECG